MLLLPDSVFDVTSVRINGGTHIYSQVQEVFDHADHSAGGCCVQRGVRLLIFAGHLGSMRHQEFHHFYVP